MAMTDEQLKEKLVTVLDSLAEKDKAAITLQAAIAGKDVVDFFFDKILEDEQEIEISLD